MDTVNVSSQARTIAHRMYRTPAQYSKHYLCNVINTPYSGSWCCFSWTGQICLDFNGSSPRIAFHDQLRAEFLHRLTGLLYNVADFSMFSSRDKSTTASQVPKALKDPYARILFTIASGLPPHRALVELRHKFDSQYTTPSSWTWSSCAQCTLTGIGKSIKPV